MHGFEERFVTTRMRIVDYLHEIAGRLVRVYTEQQRDFLHVAVSSPGFCVRCAQHHELKAGPAPAQLRCTPHRIDGFRVCLAAAYGQVELLGRGQFQQSVKMPELATE